MILFQLLFEVADDRAAEFEKTFNEVFAPALSRQKGFQSVRFFRFYSKAQAAEIEASPTEYNYQVNFVFASEADRRVWAKSPDHDVAWPKISALATKFLWRGYDLLDQKP
jgi:heme-degrading monooxygenase HmoA